MLAFARKLAWLPRLGGGDDLFQGDLKHQRHAGLEAVGPGAVAEGKMRRNDEELRGAEREHLDAFGDAGEEIGDFGAAVLA